MKGRRVEGSDEDRICCTVPLTRERPDGWATQARRPVIVVCEMACGFTMQTGVTEAQSG
jgi:hypothetical protein